MNDVLSEATSSAYSMTPSTSSSSTALATSSSSSSSSSSPLSDAERDIYSRVISAFSVARLDHPQTDSASHFPLAAYYCDAADAAESARLGADPASAAAPALDADLTLPPSDVHDCWALLASMTSVGTSATAAASALAGSAIGLPFNTAGLEPHNTAPLLLPTPAAAAARAAHPQHLRAHLAAGARAFAESLFEQHIRGVLAQSPALQTVAARLGAAPTAAWDRESADPRAIRAIVADVEGFVASSEFKTRLADGHRAYQAFHSACNAQQQQQQVAAPTSPASPWARVFCLLRAGAVRAAAWYVSEHLPHARALADALALRARGQPLAPVWRALHDEMGLYSSGSSSSSSSTSEVQEPFRVALYHLLGRFKVDAAVQRSLLTPFVLVNIDDYLWGKLCLAWTESADLPEWFVALDGATHAQAQARLSLASLQAQVLKLGEAHFNPEGTAPLLYVRVLLMAQLFEQAAAYLARVDARMAAHLTIALAHYSLIRVAEPAEPVLVPLPAAPGAVAGVTFALNAALVILRYVQTLVAAQPAAAFYYLYALRLLPVAGNAAVVGAAAMLNSAANAHASAAAVAAACAPGAARADATALGVDAPHVAALLVAGTPAALDVLVGTLRTPWLGLRALATVGLLPACYDLPAACALLCNAAEQLLQADRPADAASLLALAHRPVAAATLLLESTVTALLAPSGTVAGRGNAALALAVANAKAFIKAHGAADGSAAYDSNGFDGGNSEGESEGEGAARLSHLVSNLMLATAAAALVTEVDAGPARTEHALRALDALGLFPTAPVPAATAAAAQRFAALHPILRRTSGALVLAAARVLGARFAAATATATGAMATAQAQSEVESVRVRCKALTTFVLNNELDHVGRSVRLELMRLDAIIP